jgi:hypothetical protein
MKDLFVTYEQAVELKEFGFDEPCLKVGNPNGHILWKFMDVLDVDGVDIGDIMKEKFDDKFVELPLKTQVFKWFREKYNLLYDIVFFREDKRTKKGYWYKIHKWNSDMVKREIISNNSYFYTYEETESACINKLIEIIKEK